LGTASYMAPELFDGDPATPLSDLFSAGVVIAECLEASGARDVALADLAGRLTDPEPSGRPESASAALLMLGYGGARTTQATPAAAPGGTRRVHHTGALPALGAIAAVLAAIVVIVLVSVGGDDPQRAEEPRAAQSEQQEAPGEGGGEATEQGGGGQGPAAGAQERGGGAEPAAVPADPALGAELNRQGFDLMNAGDYERAIPVLRDAVDAFGANTDDINYAYALYNLGRSLRLAGRPDEAIPPLRERLRIPDQTDVVRRELQAALAASDG